MFGGEIDFKSRATFFKQDDKFFPVTWHNHILRHSLVL